MQVYKQVTYFLLLNEGESGEEAVRRFVASRPSAIPTSRQACGHIQVPGTDIKRACISLHVWEEELV